MHSLSEGVISALRASEMFFFFFYQNVDGEKYVNENLYNRLMFYAMGSWLQWESCFEVKVNLMFSYILFMVCSIMK